MNRGTVITGASGLLGFNWSLKASVAGPVVMVLHERIVSVYGARICKLDLGSYASIRNLLEKERPIRVIHTVALANVEECEAKPQEAYKVNVSYAENVAKACRDTGIKLVHISTDHLFDGKHAFAREDLLPNPLNVYGKTKAEAEVRVGNICGDALIVRTNFYGWGPSYRASFSDALIHSLRLGRQLNLFDDVYYTPTLIERVIEAVDILIQEGASGVYNVVGDERLSKYEFGIALAKEFGLDRTLIRRGRLDEMTNLVIRPRDMSLSSNKLKAMIGRGLGGVSEHLKRLREMERFGINLENL